MKNKAGVHPGGFCRKAAWCSVVAGGCLDVGWAIGLKYSHGFTVLWPSLGTLCCLIVSYTLFIRAMRTLPMGTAYAVYTGIAAAGTAAVGMLILGEPLQADRVLFIGLLLAGIIGLKLAETKEAVRLAADSGTRGSRERF